MGLYGIVVCGGESSRMGTDKCLLTYYQYPQYQHIRDMLLPFCERVVISCNAAQVDRIFTVHEKMIDLPEYAGNGPIAAVLTAFKTFPGHDLLIIGCDYPLLSTSELTFFLDSIKRDSVAAAFYNKSGKYEPLLACYSKDCAEPLNRHYSAGNDSLQNFLVKMNAERYTPESENAMFSVDTPEDFEMIRDVLSGKNEN